MRLAAKVRCWLVASITISLCVLGPVDAMDAVQQGYVNSTMRGVQLQSTEATTAALDKIRDAGFSFIRQGFYKDRTTIERGEYDWSYYDRLVGQLEQRGLIAYFTLFSSRENSGGTIGPRTEVEIEEYARWAAAAASHFAGRRVVWEIWNEPNIPRFWRPEGSPEEYLHLASRMCEAIRSRDPSATVIGGALAQRDRSAFLKAINSGSLAKCLSYVSIHPYRSGSPTSVGAEFGQIRAQFDNLPPLVFGEWGYPSRGERSISDERQASYAAQMMAVATALGVRFVVWYTWQDDSKKGIDREGAFGLIASDGQAKPALAAVRNVNSELAHHDVRSLCENGQTAGMGALFVDRRTGDVKLGIWTSGGDAKATVVISGPPPARQEYDRLSKYPVSERPSFIRVSDTGASTCEVIFDQSYLGDLEIYHWFGRLADDGALLNRLRYLARAAQSVIHRMDRFVPDGQRLPPQDGG